MIHHLVQLPRILARGTRTFSSKADYFQLLGLNRTFDLYPEQLKDIYKDFMKRLHPDLHTLKSSPEKISFADQASEVNAAYQILLDPHARAMHLLELLGTPMDEQASGNLVGQDFLMNIMQIREDIDNTTSQTKLRGLFDDNEKAILNTCSLLSMAFSHNKLEDELKYTAQLQYWKRIRETLVEKLAVS